MDNETKQQIIAKLREKRASDLSPKTLWLTFKDTILPYRLIETTTILINRGEIRLADIE